MSIRSNPKNDAGVNLDSGLLIKTMRAGDATHYPRPPATCRIHYVGKLPDGTVFDSSRARSRALIFRLGNEQLIPGLEEAIKRMSIGQLCQVIVPPDLAYGSTGYLPLIPPNCILTYEVELIAFHVEATEDSLQTSNSNAVAISDERRGSSSSQHILVSSGARN